MKGNIYTNQKCPACGGKMVHQERYNNCLCIDCNIPASKGYFVRFGRDICKRFRGDYTAAAQFLNGLRFKTAEGTYDRRDYQKDFPLGFITQTEKWLNVKKTTISISSWRNLNNYMNKAMTAWENTNVKTIKFAQIEDFLYDPAVVKNDKTRANMKSCLHDFFNWLNKREDIPVPKFPDCKFDLGTRTITDWDTQNNILDEIYKISYHINPKIWFGIELLSSYVELRPADLLRFNESDYNEQHAAITIHNPTKSKNKFKVIRLAEAHAEMFVSLKREYPGMPNMPFFRHVSGINRIKANAPFGQKYFYKWWIKACDNLGVKGLDLYGGTRHTTTTELARIVGTDGARKATGHETNKAFDRYCQHQDDDAFEMAQIAIQKKRPKKAKVVNIKSKTNAK